MNAQFVVQNAIDALSLGSLYALLALGIALIFGIMQLINFAHGELIMVGGYALVFVGSLSPYFVLLTVAGVVIVVGLTMERVAFRPIRGASPATLLITSFALSYLLQNIAILSFGALPKTTDLWPVFSEFFTVGDYAISKLNVLTIGVTAVLLAALTLFLTRTTRGLQMRASAEDFVMARVLGVRANRVIATAFALSGLLAATAAVLLVAQTGTVSPSFGTNPVLVGFIATVLGGMGSLVGAAVGGFALGALTIAFQAGLPLELRSYRDAFAYAVVILIFLVRPQGLIVPRSVRTRV